MHWPEGIVFVSFLLYAFGIVAVLRRANRPEEP